MNPATDCTMTMPLSIPLYRPRWQRWLDAAREAWLHWRTERATPEAAMSLHDAMALNDQTLRDIGVPEWMREQAATRREMDALVLRAARADLAGGGVRWFG